MMSLKSRPPFLPGPGTTSVASIVATSPFLFASKKNVDVRTGSSVVSASERIATRVGDGASAVGLAAGFAGASGTK